MVTPSQEGQNPAYRPSDIFFFGSPPSVATRVGSATSRCDIFPSDGFAERGKRAAGCYMSRRSSLAKLLEGQFVRFAVEIFVQQIGEKRFIGRDLGKECQA